MLPLSTASCTSARYTACRAAASCEGAAGVIIAITPAIRSTAAMALATITDILSFFAAGSGDSGYFSVCDGNTFGGGAICAGAKREGDGIGGMPGTQGASNSSL